jgi:hypothetical protein
MKDGSYSGKRPNKRGRDADNKKSVVRTSVVERGRKLLADPGYPGIDEARELARILLPML